MTDYAVVLTKNYPTAIWELSGNEYANLIWKCDEPKPTQAELDAQWPAVAYNNNIAQIETTRRTQYEAQSDGIYFAWQRGDATEAEWRAAVAKVKADNPYPPAPKATK